MPTRTETRTAPSRPLVDAGSIVVVVLGGMVPFAAFLAGNATKLVSAVPIVVFGLAWTVLCLVGFLVVRALMRGSAPLVTAAGVVITNLSFWNFGRWLSSEPGTAVRRLVGLAVWALVTALLVRLGAKLAEQSWARTFLLIFLGVWLLASLGGFVLGRQAIAGGEPPLAYSGPTYQPFQEHPNVYWFVLDEHARQDQLHKWTGSDNSWFADELNDRGFSVSQSTESAYVHTHLSMASTLSMDYPFQPGHDYRGEYELTTGITQGNNPVVDTFEQNGYKTVFAPDGSIEWSVCPPAHGDRTCIQPLGGPLGMREPYSELVLSSPVGSFELGITHNTLDSVLDGVDEVRRTTDQPLLVLAHVLSPHQPYRYETDCSWRSETVEGTKLTGEERAAAYANDVQCLDHDVIRSMDRILAGDPNAVIIVQSDHGSRLSFNWDQTYDQWSDANLQERFGALDAIRLPTSCRGDSIDGLALVNTFRLVLACLSGQEPELLDTRLFFNDYGQISTLVEVPTERVEGG